MRFKNLIVSYSRAASTGESATGVVKGMMAGAKVAQMTSALLKKGIGYRDTIHTELPIRLGEHEYAN